MLLVHTERNRRDLDDCKNSHPVPSRRNGLHACSGARRADLTRIEPRHREPSDTVEDLEDENERRRAVRGIRTTSREQDGNHHEAEAQPNRTNHQQRAPPEPVHEKDGDRRANEVCALDGTA